jgi:hypothetical protein
MHNETVCFYAFGYETVGYVDTSDLGTPQYYPPCYGAAAKINVGKLEMLTNVQVADNS